MPPAVQADARKSEGRLLEAALLLSDAADSNECASRHDAAAQQHRLAASTFAAQVTSNAGAQAAAKEQLAVLEAVLQLVAGRERLGALAKLWAAELDTANAAWEKACAFAKEKCAHVKALRHKANKFEEEGKRAGIAKDANAEESARVQYSVALKRLAVAEGASATAAAAAQEAGAATQKVKAMRDRADAEHNRAQALQNQLACERALLLAHDAAKQREASASTEVDAQQAEVRRLHGKVAEARSTEAAAAADAAALQATGKHVEAAAAARRGDAAASAVGALADEIAEVEGSLKQIEARQEALSTEAVEAAQAVEAVRSVKGHIQFAMLSVCRVSAAVARAVQARAAVAEVRSCLILISVHFLRFTFRSHLPVREAVCGYPVDPKVASLQLEKRSIELQAQELTAQAEMEVAARQAHEHSEAEPCDEHDTHAAMTRLVSTKMAYERAALNAKKATSRLRDAKATSVCYEKGALPFASDCLVPTSASFDNGQGLQRFQSVGI
jgi:hypothetical protein